MPEEIAARDCGDHARARRRADRRRDLSRPVFTTAITDGVCSTATTLRHQQFLLIFQHYGWRLGWMLVPDAYLREF